MLTEEENAWCLRRVSAALAQFLLPLRPLPPEAQIGEPGSLPGVSLLEDAAAWSCFSCEKLWAGPFSPAPNTFSSHLVLLFPGLTVSQQQLNWLPPQRWRRGWECRSQEQKGLPRTPSCLEQAS